MRGDTGFPARTGTSPITEKLKAKGAEVYVGHSREYIKDPDLVVYTSAVDQSNPELEAAREKGIETMTGQACWAFL